MPLTLPLLGTPILFEDQFNADQHVYGSDSFNRDDSASSLGALDGGEKSGTAWTQHTGTGGIATNKAYMAAFASGEARAAAEFGVSDCEVQAVWNGIIVGGNRSIPEIVFRYVDASNFFYIYDNGTSLLLRRNLAGSITTLATVACVMADSTDYTLKIVLLGTAIKVFVDGIRLINTTDANFTTATRHGIRVEVDSANTAARFENFSVKAIVPNPGKWTKVDTESKITQASGLLSFSGGKATPAWSDPLLVLTSAVSRRAGVCLEVGLDGVDVANFISWFGFNTDSSPGDWLTAEGEALVALDPSAVLRINAGGTTLGNTTISSYAALTNYRFRIVLGHWDTANRQISANGCTIYVQGGTFGTLGGASWVLLGRFSTGTTASLYAVLMNRSHAIRFNYVRVYQHPFPMPRVYDSMVRADGAIGSAESGQAYVAYSGTIATVTSNEGYFPDDNSGNRTLLNAGVGDGIFQLDVKGDVDTTLTNYRHPGLFFRVADPAVNTGLLVSVNEGNVVRLQKVSAGSFTSLASGAVATADDTYATIAVLAIGAVIKVFVNGALYITHTLVGGDEATYANTATYYGPRLIKTGSPSVAARFKNLLVQPGLGV